MAVTTPLTNSWSGSDIANWLNEIRSALIELQTDLNALRTDFRAHDHGNTGSYVQAAITLRVTADTFSGQAETNAATVVVAPQTVPAGALHA